MPLPKSEKQLKAEEELGEALRTLFERNKISASESMDIMKRARKCGLSFANPASKSLPKAEKSEERDTNAARTVKRFMDKRKVGKFLLGSHSPLGAQKETSRARLAAFPSASRMAV